MSRCFDRVEELQELVWRVFQRINLHTRKFLSKQGLTMARFFVLKCVLVIATISAWLYPKAIYSTRLSRLDVAKSYTVPTMKDLETAAEKTGWMSGLVTKLAYNRDTKKT